MAPRLRPERQETMKPNAYSHAATIRLALATSADVEDLRAVVSAIRALPEVLGVRADYATRRLEILYQEPAERIVERIHRCLAAVRQSLAYRCEAGGSAHATS